MKKIRLIIRFATFLLFMAKAGQAISQEKITLEVGKAMPDFVLTDVQYFDKQRISLNDFRGKWLILDFWNSHCHSCIKSHPHIDSLQKEFKDRKVQFVLVGYTGSQFFDKPDDLEIRALHAKQRQLNKLSLPIAFDSLLFHKLDIRPTPYIVIVDPEGVVQGITIQLSSKQLNGLLAGHRVDLYPAYTSSQTKIVRAEKRKIEEKK